MLFPRNRYRPEELLKQLANRVPTRDGRAWCLEFDAADDALETEDFVAYLPDVEQEHKNAIESYRQILSSIDVLDNLVQQSCEEEYSRSGMRPDNFKFHIAFLKLTPGGVEIEYYGTVVNTSWPAIFVRTKDGLWKPVNFEVNAPPD